MACVLCTLRQLEGHETAVNCCCRHGQIHIWSMTMTVIHISACLLKSSMGRPSNRLGRPCCEKAGKWQEVSASKEKPGRSIREFGKVEDVLLVCCEASCQPR
mmetsp:Transcript_31447/g.61755  ORF Transcript_31447/g.61755 Transcript_31447/m.61755 type:complete len:102 (-) Transcript_31447:39-344(-)